MLAGVIQLEDCVHLSPNTQYLFARTVLIFCHPVHAAMTRYNVGSLPLTNNALMADLNDVESGREAL